MATSFESSTSSEKQGSINSQSKLKKNSEKFQSPLFLSSLLHAFIIGVVLCLIIFHVGQKQKIEIEIYDQPVASPQAMQLTKPVEIPVKPMAQARKVFGVSKNAMTDSASGVSEKAGNTLATAPDNLKLDDNDRDLPIPTDEYLVDVMPILKDEIRVPYPANAKEKNIEGPVVMDILVDKDGIVRQVKVVSGPGFGLDEAASNAIDKFHFIPAKVKAQAVAARIRYTYRFVLQK